MYVKAKLISSDGSIKNIVSFGPFTIDKAYQRKGYGRKLLDYSLKKVKAMGYDTIVIFGNPENYACYGFKNCKKYNICIEKDVYPVSLMVKVLDENALENKDYQYIECPDTNIDMSEFEKFDSTFPEMEKGYSYTQELFYIYSRSNVVR